MYVKTTKTIWNEIESKINAMFDARINSTLDWYKYGLDKKEFDAICLEQAFPRHLRELAEQLGNLFTVHTAIDVVIRSTDHTISERYRIENINPVPLPQHWIAYPYSLPYVSDPKIVEIAIKRETAKKRETAERNTFKEQVAEIFNQAPSVNALLKAWPPIRDLLPNAIIDKCETKIERRAFEKKVIQSDAQALNVSLLKAKISA